MKVMAWHQDENEMRAVFAGDNESLTVVVTPEGVIMHAYVIDEDGSDMLVGAVDRMADEWFEHVEGEDG